MGFGQRITAPLLRFVFGDGVEVGEEELRELFCGFGARDLEVGEEGALVEEVRVCCFMEVLRELFELEARSDHAAERVALFEGEGWGGVCARYDVVFRRVGGAGAGRGFVHGARSLGMRPRRFCRAMVAALTRMSSRSEEMRCVGVVRFASSKRAISARKSMSLARVLMRRVARRSALVRAGAVVFGAFVM